jgi:hypothetical protein
MPLLFLQSPPSISARRLVAAENGYEAKIWKPSAKCASPSCSIDVAVRNSEDKTRQKPQQCSSNSGSRPEVGSLSWKSPVAGRLPVQSRSLVESAEADEIGKFRWESCYQRNDFLPSLFGIHVPLIGQTSEPSRSLLAEMIVFADIASTEYRCDTKQLLQAEY